MRDNKKNLSYFNQLISEFEELNAELVKTRGNVDEGVQIGYLTLSNLYRNKCIAMYSVGKSIDSIKTTFIEWVNCAEKTWSNNSSYVYLIWMISISILLHIKDELYDKFSSVIKRKNIHDYLIEFLLSKKNLIGIDERKSYVEQPYSFWRNIFVSDKYTQIELVKEYLTEKWYEAHNYMDWYDSHKSKNNTYSGYWSFESGAIVKILGLDDTELKDVPYYPYDMVHYIDNK